MKKAKILAHFYAAFLALLLLSAPAPAYAVQPDEILANPQLESRARELSAQLRCLVCRNENIDDSNAPLARDLRLLLRERLMKGDSDRQALQFMTDRYGEYVLLKPPFSGAAIILWLFPLGLLLSAAGILFYAGRRAKKRSAPPPLTAAEKARLKVILAEDADNDETAEAKTLPPKRRR